MKKLCHHIGDTYRLYLFIGLCVLLLGAQICFLLQMAQVCDFSLKLLIFISLADAAVILLPFVFLPPRWRWSVTLPMVILPLFFEANVLYFRNFSDLLPLASVLSPYSYNAFVLKSAQASVQRADVVFGLGVALFCAIFAILKPWRIKSGFGRRGRLMAVAATAVMFILEMTGLQYIFYEHEGDPREPYTISGHIDLLKRRMGVVHRMKLRFAGLPLYLTSELWQAVKPAPELTDSDKALIHAFFTDNPSPRATHLPDNSGKNLILVVVESLNTQLLELSDASGQRVLGFLDSLTRAPEARTYRHMRSLAAAGRSSDGNMMYVTGMLPTLDMPASTTYMRGDYPSLPRALGRYSVEIIPESALTWNHAGTSLSFGYDRLYQDICRGLHPGQHCDSLLFAAAMPILRTLPQPFMAAVFTMDMHDPYTDTDNAGAALPPHLNLTHDESVYVRRAMLFDNALRDFIAALKAGNLYNNSVIVIVSDHNVGSDRFENPHLNKEDILLCILNAGFTGPDTGKRINQCDVYPTLLDLLGASGYRWRGFGTSLLADTTDRSGPPPPRAYDISARMIKSAHLPLHPITL